MSLAELLGASVPVFIGLTVVLMGGAAFLTGQAMARGWRSPWQAAFYGLLLAAGDRFLVFALFGGALFSLSGYLAAAIWLLTVTLITWRATRRRQMRQQYPWLYGGVAGTG